MSYQGQSPKVNRLRLQPRSADPVNPAEGDLQYADGTARPEGVYVYKNGSWLSLVDATGNVNTLLYNPQSSDPVSPAVGTVFNSDGTSREAGLWRWDGTGWQQISRLRYQEFKHSTAAPIRIKAISTNNISINLSPLYNGQNSAAWDSVTVQTGDLVLFRNQVNAAENGVYVVPATSGTLQRAAALNSAVELNKAVVYAANGSQANKKFVQTATITTVDVDAQNWADDSAATRPSFSFIVPRDVSQILVQFAGAGGGGGSGGGAAFGAGGGSGGAGGMGTILETFPVAVTPGETLQVVVGTGGVGGVFVGSGYVNGNIGQTGSSSAILRSSTTILYADGGSGGNRGNMANSNAGQIVSGAAGWSSGWEPTRIYSGSGSGGQGQHGGNSATAGAAGAGNRFGFSGGTAGPVGPAPTVCGGGGGGGAAGAFGNGAAGGTGGSGGAGATNGAHASAYCAGGGGGGGAGTTGVSGAGGEGGNGYVKLIW